MKNSILIFTTICSCLVLSSRLLSSIQTKLAGQEDTLHKKPPFITGRSSWADSVLLSLTPQERIAQLFMIAAFSNDKCTAEHIAEITTLIKDYKIGGLIFMQGGPVRQAQLTNYYQSLSKTPLMISIDGEWGLAMRLDSTVKYPRQMMLGAIKDDSLIYRMGADIAGQCKRMGIHVNFAPVVDVNNNPGNPVINSRSFGEDKMNVSQKGIAYMKGMQDKRILATAKHFPGHGDTDTDSHKALPEINHTRNHLDEIELYPFTRIIAEGAGSVMVAHLFVPALDSTKNIASTLSKPIVTGLLQNEMKFEGLVFTDALNMKGVSAYNKPGELDLKALIAGNDVLLFAEDVPAAIAKITDAVVKGEISQEEIDMHCKKILYAKHWLGLDSYRPIEIKNLYSDLNDSKYELTNRLLVESSLTLLTNRNDILPLRSLDTLKIASVSIGEISATLFQKRMEKYAPVKHFFISRDPSKEHLKELMTSLDSFNLIVVGMHQMNESPVKNFGLLPETVRLINDIALFKKTVLVLFGNPYSLGKFIGSENLDGLLVSYNESGLVQDYSAQLVFGGIGAKGTLPVTPTPLFPAGFGMATNSIRLKYTIPEDAGILSTELIKIDSIIAFGIQEHAFPGCQLLVAKNGMVISDKSYGFHTYENKQKVKDDDLYDLASITKVASSAISAMRLQDEGKFVLDHYLCDYLPELVDSSSYRNVNLREMLAHQAGFISWVPFYEKTLHKGEPRYEIYSIAQSEAYPFRVAERMYIHKEYPGIIYRRIIETPIKGIGEYKYSDLGYYFMLRIIEKQTGISLNEYADKYFYKSLGTVTMGYLPRKNFDINRIVPTEYDLLFRKQLVHGDVHDPGAAMLGGVGGHAGLFSNANDLAKVMQMLLNGGEYGGGQYISHKTLAEWTRCQYCINGNRRGAAFDKPANGEGGPTCECVSLESFGHTGFTGTIAWSDPKEKVVYIFLSNRIYPNADNNKLLKMGVRTQIMQVIYDAIRKSGKNLSGNP